MHSLYQNSTILKLGMSCGIDDLSELLEFTSWEYLYVIYDTNYWLSETKINKKYYHTTVFFFNENYLLQMFTEDPRRCPVSTAYDLQCDYPRMP